MGAIPVPACAQGAGGSSKPDEWCRLGTFHEYVAKERGYADILEWCEDCSTSRSGKGGGQLGEWNVLDSLLGQAPPTSPSGGICLTRDYWQLRVALLEKLLGTIVLAFSIL